MEITGIPALKSGIMSPAAQWRREPARGRHKPLEVAPIEGRRRRLGKLRSKQSAALAADGPGQTARLPGGAENQPARGRNGAPGW